MATISFWSDNIGINNSGLGFYGATFGNSVAVGSYQQTTFITNSAGTALGPQVNNVKWANQSSGIVDSSTTGIALTAIPNADATLEIRFEHSTPVFTQNAQIKIHDRVSTSNAASGVTTKVAEVRHIGATQLNNGSGDTAWTHFSGGILSANQTKNLTPGPGSGGRSANGVGAYDMSHSHYLAMSVSPDTIGSKSFAMYFSVEYL
jgi:hypothetical protein